MLLKKGIYYRCSECNKECYAPKHREKTAKTCSRKCSQKVSAKRQAANCKICGKEFSFIHSRIGAAKYCGRTCYYKAQHIIGSKTLICKVCNKQKRTKKSDPSIYCSMICMGIHRRSKMTGATVRKDLFKRLDNIACSLCGYNEHTEILGVHHIDHNHSNNNLDNLLVVCANCHSLQHKKHIVHGGINAIKEKLKQKSVRKEFERRIENKTKKTSIGNSI